MLHVPMDMNGEKHLVLMSQMVALPSATLGPVIGSASAVRDELVRAVALLVTGF